MIPLALNKPEGLNILCLGAHCDDIEIGCGGFILKLINTYPVRHIKWVVLTSNHLRAEEAKKSAAHFLMNANSKDITVMDFKDTILPQQLLAVKDVFEGVKASYSPDIIFTHYRYDLHQDHRLVNDLTWNTFRDHFILEYEIQKYDGDLGNPGFFVPLDQAMAEQKVNALLEYFPSQSKRHWFDRETFYALMRIRGLECASRYAEAFYVRKAIF
jgi:LmbE family N-acetylglucosaminyl deacetylase